MVHSLLKSDKIGGLITILFGIISLKEAMKHYPSKMNFMVGDHTLPGLVGITMVLLGTLLILFKAENFKVEFPKGIILKKLIGTLIIMFIYWFLITSVGYIISTFLILTALFKLIGSYNVAKSILFSIISTAVLYGLFIYWLQMPFPKGLFGV